MNEKSGEKNGVGGGEMDVETFWPVEFVVTAALDLCLLVSVCGPKE